MMLQVSKIIFLFVAAFIYAGMGCAKDPFSVRDSENPQSPGGTFVNPVAAEIAMENLFFSYNEKNIGNFTRCLTDSFVFSFDIPILDQEEWPVNQELRITEAIFQEVDSIRLDWTTSPSKPDQETDSTARYYRLYDLTVITAGSPPETTAYAGEAMFDLIVTESSLWVINRWHDLHLEQEEYSWADLKSLYYR